MPSLTSHRLLVAAVLVLLVLVVFSAVAMGRMRGSTRRLRTLGLVLGCQVLTAVVAALALNVDRLYVRTLADLFPDGPPVAAVLAPPTMPPPPAADTGAGRPATAPGPDPRWVGAFAPGQAGALEATWTGPVSGINQKVQVWLPRGYAPDDARTYDVLVVLHGYPGYLDEIGASFPVAAQVQAAMNAGRLRPTIVVAPGMGAVDWGPTTCLDVPQQPADETWLSVEVPQMLRTTFPNITTDRAGLQLLGVSAGAWCAGRLALDAPGTWAGAIMMSGYDPPEVGPLTNAPVALRQQNTLSTMLGSRPAGAPGQAFYLFGTSKDDDATRLAERFVPAVRPSDVVATASGPGGHNWAAWTKALPDALEWWAHVRGLG